MIEQLEQDEEGQEQKFPVDDDYTDDDYKPAPVDDEKYSPREAKKTGLAKMKRVVKEKKKRTQSTPKRPRRKGMVGRPRSTIKLENVPRANDWVCYICKSEPHENYDALFTHLHIAHEGELPHTCPICVTETVVIDSVTTLNVHKKMHAMPFKCPHCDHRYVCKRGVVDHVARAHSELAEPCPSQCPQCDKILPTKAALQFHIYRHKMRIACDICGKVYSSKHKLRIHIQRKHSTNPKKVECHICHKLLQSHDSIQNHLKIMHTTAEPLKCPYCPKSYTSKYSLQYHVKKHEADPTKGPSNDWKQYYTFVEGEEGIRNGARLKKCTICNAVVQQISIHLKNKHFREEHRCTLCDATFRDKKPLQVHMLEHSVGKFLKCPICDREFMQRDHLVKHLRTKKHRDHPMAQSLDWLDAKYPSTVYGKKSGDKDSTAEAVAGIIGDP